MKTLKNFNLKEKKVLLRSDFNVPLNKEGGILDDFRIKKALPTIKYLISKEAKLILMSHLGRPEGRTVERLRLTQVQNKLTEYLNISVTKSRDCVGKEVESWTKEMKSGEILLLENLRFHQEEVINDEKFAKELSKLGEIYINDAFSVCHRIHASIVGIPKYLPAGAGFLLEKEIKVLAELIKNPKKPLLAIIGGKKAETKAKLIDKISEIGEGVLISGLIAREIKEKNIKLKNPKKVFFPIDEIDGKDIGPKTLEIFKEKIKLAETIIWNGPLGMFEEKEYEKGSREIAKTIAESEVFSVAGGGETLEFINKIGLSSGFNHLSTGGGAMLDFIVDGSLVGIEILK